MLCADLGGAFETSPEADLFLAFTKNPDESLFHDRDNDAVRVSLALRNVIHSTNIRTGIVDSPEEVGWRTAFMETILELLVGFRGERPLLAGQTVGMLEWMRLRAITIGGSPFLFFSFLFFSSFFFPFFFPFFLRGPY